MWVTVGHSLQRRTGVHEKLRCMPSVPRWMDEWLNQRDQSRLLCLDVHTRWAILSYGERLCLSEDCWLVVGVLLTCSYWLSTSSSCVVVPCDWNSNCRRHAGLVSAVMAIGLHITTVLFVLNSTTPEGWKAELTLKMVSSHRCDAVITCLLHISDATQLNSTVATVGDNAMTSLALWRHAAVHGPRVVC